LLHEIVSAVSNGFNGERSREGNKDLRRERNRKFSLERKNSPFFSSWRDNAGTLISLLKSVSLSLSGSTALCTLPAFSVS
jgi:hypothetical protein